MTQPITVEKVRVMKERLYAMFKFFELSRSLREEVKGVGLYEENSEEFQQLLTNYLYEVNLR
jgi:hypothetical protein